MRQQLAAVVMLGSVSGCVASGGLPRPAATAPPLDPIAFFAGTTHGEGRLRIATRRPRSIAVEGHGVAMPDGTIRLEQTVTVAGQAPTRRQWTLRRAGDGGFSGALSDASGPVRGRLAAGRLHLRFAMKGGFQAEQTLALQADGRTLHNVMIVRKFGLPVARLDEVIRKTD